MDTRDLNSSSVSLATYSESISSRELEPPPPFQSDKDKRESSLTEEELIIERRLKRKAILKKYCHEENSDVKKNDQNVIKNENHVNITPKPNIDVADDKPLEIKKLEKVERLEVQNGRKMDTTKSITSSAPPIIKIIQMNDSDNSISVSPLVKEEKSSAFVNEKEDEVDDMFSDYFQEKLNSAQTFHNISTAKVESTLMVDNADDAQGYYLYSTGEILNNRYEIKAELGKGMFGSVIRALDRQTGLEVAIKIIRKDLHQSGLKELDFLQKMMKADPEGKKHVIPLLDHFEYRKHLCVVLELLYVNLRDLLKRFGKNVGLNINAVRAYATQMFHSLSLLHKCKIIHADIKPDNILVSSNHLVIKLCDFGTAISINDIKEDQRTPYLVSRYYRAPEIILGVPYDYAVDMWSVGCTLYELYTGRILFPGRTNNEMLKYMMDYKGKFSHKMLRRGKESGKYFNESDNYSFSYRYRDSLTDQEMTSVMNITQPTKDIKSALLQASGTSQTSADLQMIHLFADLLDKCFTLNPEKRINWKEASQHPFIKKTTQ